MVAAPAWWHYRGRQSRAREPRRAAVLSPSHSLRRAGCTHRCCDLLDVFVRPRQRIGGNYDKTPSKPP